MTTVNYAGHDIDITTEGFLTNKDLWDRDVAQAIANEAGVGPLTDLHWKVIEYMRADEAENGQSPGMRRIAKYSGVDMRTLYKLFPKGPGKLAARIAGLPKPKSCV